MRALKGQRLTLREKFFILRLSQGDMNKEIANTLGITTRQANDIRARIFKKLGASNVANAIFLFIQSEVLDFANTWKCVEIEAGCYKIL